MNPSTAPIVVWARHESAAADDAAKVEAELSEAPVLSGIFAARMTLE
jgi:hypothetical protein